VDLVDPSLDQDRIGDAMEAMRANGATEQQVHEAGIFDLGRQVGAIQMARMQRDFSAVAEVRLFEEVKKSNKFKDLAISLPNGSSAMAENLEDFCRLVFGTGYKVMAEESRNLQVLGQASFESAQRIGLNRREIRMIRALPEAQRAIVDDALKSESRAEVVAAIEDLASQLSKAQSDTEEALAELEAERELSGKKTQKIEQLKRDKVRINKLPPEDALIELRKEATAIALDSEASVLGGLRQAFIALSEHEGEDNIIFMAGLAGQVQRRLNELREEFELPDLSNADDVELANQVAQWATGEVKGAKGGKGSKG
jgi:hypothetical protein